MEDMIFQRIESLMRSKGHKTKEMLDYLDLKRCTYDNWKAGKSKSYLKYIDKISEFLEVTPNYIVSGLENGASVAISNPIEDELITVFRLAPKEIQDSIMTILKHSVNNA